MKGKMIKGIVAAFGVMLLILDAPTALESARDGVGLCMYTIIPSLLPFFVLINLLNSAVLGSKFRYFSLIEQWLRIPCGSGSIFLSGLLGGYPTGAQLVHSAWHDGSLSKKDAERMLAFCSNAGPAFLFGILAQQFDTTAVVWMIWLIHVLSCMAVARFYFGGIPSSTVSVKDRSLSVSDSLQRAVSGMASVCGWVILFRVICGFCTRWFLWAVSPTWQAVLISLMELSNGILLLGGIENEGIRMLVAVAAVNFGGICVLMQTTSVANGLKIRSYIQGKLLQTAIGMLIVIPVQYFLFSEGQRMAMGLQWLLTPVVLILILCHSLQKSKITVAFPGKKVYNDFSSQRKG